MAQDLNVPSVQALAYGGSRQLSQSGQSRQIRCCEAAIGH